MKNILAFINDLLKNRFFIIVVVACLAVYGGYLTKSDILKIINELIDKIRLG